MSVGNSKNSLYRVDVKTLKHDYGSSEFTTHVIGLGVQEKFTTARGIKLLRIFNM
jgi:hypothetical protein